MSASSVGVASYLTSEGALPWASPLKGSNVFGQPEGAAIALPEPFDSCVVSGVARGPLRAWKQNRKGRGWRFIVIKPNHAKNWADLTVEIPLGALAFLLRNYYEGKGE